jgi:hypothetical protein
MTNDASRPELSVEHSPVTDAPLVHADEADVLASLRPRLKDVVAEPDVERLVHEVLVSLGPVRVTTYLPILVERRVRQLARVSA